MNSTAAVTVIPRNSRPSPTMRRRQALLAASCMVVASIAIAGVVVFALVATSVGFGADGLDWKWRVGVRLASVACLLPTLGAIYLGARSFLASRDNKLPGVILLRFVGLLGVLVALAAFAFDVLVGYLAFTGFFETPFDFGPLGL